ncbi:phosphatase [Candidatus Saganbacteria bacterium CG08_land_8_20_14_0_20_45_16]|uniref:Phosphatase n=1 Tax=Candidatus Saganbacteria bacterium CG08_land_8_20_14_0_20_45_16 TaxID=2014293 RepID=A0A2H0XYL2_UNCSA|nr:MAG: phosphatase [Candidatus Saganbacteria bacterium CG08_land_8_20_14_0_20_45_16]
MILKLVADLHVHTVSSGHAYSTLEEYVAQAKKIGLKAFAVAEHGPAMPGAPHFYYFANMKMIPPVIDGIRVYRGIEANIINDQGELDLDPELLDMLDVVIVAMHPRCGYDSQGEGKNTEVLIKALERYPQINITAHLENLKYPVNFEQVIQAARKHNVAIELNNSSPISRVGSEVRWLDLAREVKKQDWKVVLTTDSHFSTMIGVVDESLKIVKQAGLSEKQIINRSFKEMEAWLALRKKSTQ